MRKGASSLGSSSNSRRENIVESDALSAPQRSFNVLSRKGEAIV